MRDQAYYQRQRELDAARAARIAEAARLARGDEEMGEGTDPTPEQIRAICEEMRRDRPRRMVGEVVHPVEMAMVSTFAVNTRRSGVPADRR